MPQKGFSDNDPTLVAEKTFRTHYPETKKIKEISPTVVTGLYKIIAGKNTFYFHPESKAIFFGEIKELSSDAKKVAQNHGASQFAEIDELSIDDFAFYLSGNLALFGEFWLDGAPIPFKSNGGNKQTGEVKTLLGVNKSSIIDLVGQ